MIEETRKTLALALVKQAGKYLRDHFQKVHEGVLKADGSMVSVVDRKVEEMMISKISSAFPSDGILSEEQKEIKKQGEYRWIIDPLDGTHNFLAGLPLFGTILALAHKGEVILGVCGFPIFEELLIGERGCGATLNGAPIHVSPSASLEGEFFLSDGNMRRAKDRVLKDIARLSSNGCRIRILGNAAMSMTRIACKGGLIATNRAVNPWDVAAPCLIVEEAGGRVTDAASKKWSVTSPELIATNGVVHDKVLEILNV